MADANTSKIDAAAEKAYAEAAAKKIDLEKVEAAVEEGAKPAPKIEAVAKAVEAPAKSAPVKTPAARKTAAKRKPAAKKVAAKKPAQKPAAKKTAKRKVAAKKAAPAKAPAKNVAAKAASTITKAKETIMATAKNAKTTDFVDTAKSVAADAQTRLKSVYAKGSEVAGDVVAFHKHNLEAVVESGKVLTSGMQDLGREAVTDTKKVAEQVTEDVRLMAAVKSPTELLKLQGDMTRRNLDAAIAYSSKSTEAWLKLANEAMAPITSRASEAAEKFKKAA